MRITRIRSIVVAMLLGVTAVALAHGDEDHSQDKAAKPTPTAAGATPGASGMLQRLADGSLFVPKPVQRQLEIRTRAAHIGDLAATVELNGKVIPDPNSSGRVQASFAGSVMPGPKGMPVPGRRVAKGEVLAYLRPVSGTIERGNQRSQLAELEAQLAIADGRVRRFEQLEGAVPQKEIEAARIERDALQKRRAFVGASINAAEPLLAPAAGVISASHHLVAGQIVDAREVLFEIVDPARLVVQASAFDTALLGNIASATASPSAGTTVALRFVGAGRTLQEGAIPLQFNTVASKGAVALAVNQPVKVYVQTKDTVKGFAVPTGAVVKNPSNQDIVWVHTGPEVFEARTIRAVALDGANVSVVDGLKAGDRVVTQGAPLVNQVR